MEKYPENIEVDGQGEMIGNVDVSVDGTWQRRGHTSKLGVVFVISVGTGEVLDYAVNSRSKVDSDCFKNWFDSHKDTCAINHQGSSDAMETNGSIEIFLRSKEMHNLRHKTFVGDGDSSCFANVAKACFEMYRDDYVIVKEECVGHIQKRIERALRAYKKKMKGKTLQDGKAVGGKGRLTDVMVVKDG